jgi:hypothetical protein
VTRGDAKTRSVALDSSLEGDFKKASPAVTASPGAWCPRCGAPLLTLADLADLAMKAERGLRDMRLALPSVLTAGVRVLAAALPCYAGTCTQAGSPPASLLRNQPFAAPSTETK